MIDHGDRFRVIDIYREPSVYDPRLVASVFTRSGFTRPANTTAYAAKDVMTDGNAKAMEFPNISPIPGAGVDILSAFMISSNPSSTPGSFTLMLFNSPQDLASDNAAYAPTNQDMTSFIGLVSFDGSKVNSNSAVYYPIGFGHLYVRLSPSSTSVYGVLIADSAYPPISRENFIIKLYGEIMR